MPFFVQETFPDDAGRLVAEVWGPGHQTADQAKAWFDDFSFGDYDPREVEVVELSTKPEGLVEVG